MAIQVPSMRLTTPAGTAVWPFIDTPGEDFNKENEEFRTSLVLNAEAASPIIEKLESLVARAADFFKEQTGKNLKVRTDRPWNDEQDDAGQPTGNIVFKFKLPAKVTRKSDGKVIEFRPKVYDAGGKLLGGEAVPAIGGGSTLRISAEARTYNVQGVGVKLSLVAAQVIDLVTRENNRETAEDHGFDAVEGYVARSDFEKETEGDF